MKIRSYCTNNKEDLSIRAQRILANFENEASLLEYFQNHGSFKNFTNIGAKTNEELISYCENLKIQQPAKNLLTSIEINDQSEKLIKVYEGVKNDLPNRLKNALNKLELDDNYNLDNKNKLSFINKYFLSGFDFSRIRNLGKTSLPIINQVPSLIVNYYGGISDFESLHKKNRIKAQIRNGLGIEIEDNLLEFVLEDPFYFHRLFCCLLYYYSKKNEKLYQVIKRLFFSPEEFERRIVSNELSCSQERVRQLSNQAKTKVVPKLVRFIMSHINLEPTELSYISDKNIITLESFPEFTFNNMEFQPNNRLSKIALGVVYRKNYRLVDSFLNETKSFNLPEQVILILKSFAEQNRFAGLIKWADDQIYEFETNDFDYRIDTLIERFYVTAQINLAHENLKELTSLINTVKKRSWEFMQVEPKRQQKKELIKTILNEVYTFLKEKNEGQSTSSILELLQSHNIKIKRHNLLHYLKSNPNTYVRLGIGYWGLKENNQENKTTGSLRQIIISLLSNSEEPVHISNIVELINSYKKVSIHSIISNLKADTSNSFIFFNCSYIGLRTKKYSEFWNAIPQFKIAHLKKYLKILAFERYHDEVVKQLELKYGYPEMHIRYMIKRLTDNQRKEE